MLPSPVLLLYSKAVLAISCREDLESTKVIFKSQLNIFLAALHCQMSAKRPEHTKNQRVARAAGPCAPLRRDPADPRAGSCLQDTESATHLQPAGHVSSSPGSALAQGNERDPRDERTKRRSSWVACEPHWAICPQDERNGLYLRHSCGLDWKHYISSLATGSAARL